VGGPPGHTPQVSPVPSQRTVGWLLRDQWCRWEEYTRRAGDDRRQRTPRNRTAYCCSPPGSTGGCCASGRRPTPVSLETRRTRIRTRIRIPGELSLACQLAGGGAAHTRTAVFPGGFWQLNSHHTRYAWTGPSPYTRARIPGGSLQPHASLCWGEPTAERAESARNARVTDNVPRFMLANRLAL